MTYAFRAFRKSDFLEIRSYFIHDTQGAGREAMATAVKHALIESHPLAKGLRPEDLIVELSARMEIA